jgi:hypothetical protein
MPSMGNVKSLLEATLRNRARSMTPEIWVRMGTSLEAVLPFMLEAAQKSKIDPFATFQNGFFAKLVPNVRKLGLLDETRCRLREKWGETGLLDFEFADDTSAHYEEYDEDQGSRRCG